MSQVSTLTSLGLPVERVKNAGRVMLTTGFDVEKYFAKVFTSAR